MTQRNDMNTNDMNTSGSAAARTDRSGWLWVSAGVLAALIVVQGGGLFESQAYGEMSTTGGAYSMMSTDGGNDEILVVVDSRQESLMVYRTDGVKALKMLEREELSSLFSRARARAVGGP